MKYLSIRKKLIILTLITLIPLIVLQAVNIQNNFQRSTEQELQSNVELAHAISEFFYGTVQVLWEEEAIIGTHIASEINNIEEIQSYLETIVNTDDINIQRLSLVNTDGIIIASTRKYMIGQSVAGRDYFKKISSGADRVVSELIESYVDGAMLTPVVKGVRKDGKLIGMLVYSVDVDELVSNFPDFNLNKGDSLILIDRNGRMTYNSMNNKIPYEKRMISNNSTVWKALKGNIVRIYKSEDGYRMGVDYPIKEIGWVCSLSSDRRTVLSSTCKQAEQSVITLAVVTIISLAASYVFGKKIAEPLVVLKNKATEFKSGNYSARSNISGYDEIAATAEAFDLMAESIEEYDKLKSQFFSNLSHEFKTPINVIYSGTQLIESLQSNSDCREFKNITIRNMGVIRQNCYRLMRLIDNMIDVTRYDTGKFKMALSNQNIVSVIEDVSLSVVKFAEQKGVTIVFDTETEEKEMCCDPNMIERIILNLISNALKFTDAGGYIYINVYDRLDKVAFAIRDTGVGMPKDKLAVIFDRFRQLDSSLNRNHEGSGLGLSIVKALVEAHKGSITVNSEPGNGTEFVVELPAVLLPEEASKNSKSLLKNESDTIQKIEIEFSDIYSVGKNSME